MVPPHEGAISSKIPQLRVGERQGSPSLQGWVTPRGSAPGPGPASQTPNQPSQAFRKAMER